MDGENWLAGLGAVISSKKEFVAAAVSTVNSVGDVEMAEAKAVLWGMQAAITAGAASVIIESDSKGVVQPINNNNKGTLTEIFWVILDILELNKNFQNFKAQHVFRRSHILAHFMAKLALKKFDSSIWLDEIPVDIMYLFSL